MTATAISTLDRATGREKTSKIDQDRLPFPLTPPSPRISDFPKEVCHGQLRNETAHGEGLLHDLIKAFDEALNKSLSFNEDFYGLCSCK